PVPVNTYTSFQFELLDANDTRLKGVKKSGLEITLAVADLFITPTITLPATPFYRKVTSTSDLKEGGSYLIVYEGDESHDPVAFNGALTTLDAVGNGVAVTINADNTIAKSTDVDAAAFTISIENGTVCSASGNYIGVSSYSNALKQDTDATTYVHTEISINETTGAYLGFSFQGGDMTLRYNYASNQLRFRYYKDNGQAPIALYLLDGTGLVDNRQEAGMSWSATDASASWDTGNTVSGFTAPTLTVGNATGITYESTEPSVATVSDAGAVTILGPGETTIKAIFAGNDNYKPQTVSYTLTITDNRDKVEAPVIAPDASNTVATGTEVTITCATEGATIYYTLNETDPTSESNKYSSAIVLNDSKTVKAIAVKEGYKDSDVVTVIYTVGVVNTSTESNPYSASQAIQTAMELANNGTLEDVYVSGIISKITTAYNSQYGNVSFNISADGLETSEQFMIFRAEASSADDFQVGDAVEFKGTLKNYVPNNSTTHTYELDAAATLIAQLRKPTFTPDGGSFTESQSVTIAAEDGASILYSIDDSAPATTYESALTLTETTTVKAVASKGILTTGVATAKFTKSSGGSGTEYETAGNLATFTFTESSKPVNNTDFAATSGSCPASTFRLNGSGSTWNTTKGWAFTSITSVVVTIKTTRALKKGASIKLSMDTFYNKASNAPMKGFTITASESNGTSSTTGLDVTSWTLSTSSANKAVTYTIQNDVAANSSVVFTLTGTGKAGAGQGFINNVKADYTD
ncbi:MAG: chitobiase/beta-hexosaminidase C-terminal domain-containing protein, partial [Bacteroidales bacterium]|nr:chitobiase/beta-hexosaminidase C-terminal domain-containing protein [Bacteroidales bacterium]